MIYLTSDLHFGHKLVSGIRGYESPEAHDAAVIQSWRRTVKEGDHVWVLGDLAVAEPSAALAIISDLPGIKHLVSGNHDGCHPMHRGAWKMQREYLAAFESVQSAARMRVARNGERTNVLLSHFPYSGDHTAEDRHEEWRLPDCGSWLLHGHTHSTAVRQFPRSVHVGWDAWRRLVKWSEVEQLILGGA